jgi:hypothetical protein
MGIKQTIIELKKEYRDFFLEIAYEDLPMVLLEKLRILKSGADGLIKLRCDEYELDLMIGLLTLEANYHDDNEVRKKACHIKAILKGYREQLKV